MAMNKDYWRTRLEAAIRNANDAFPGTLSWADVRWEIERAQATKAAEALASIVKDVPLADLALMYAVAAEECDRAAQPASTNSTADYVDRESSQLDAPSLKKLTELTEDLGGYEAERKKPAGKKGRKRG